MSGGSGSDYRPNPRPTRSDGGGASDPCDIVEILTLNSPSSNVLSTLNTGTVLEVEYISGPPQQLVAKTLNGAVAGTITSASMIDLIECIQQGNSYQGEVISVLGGACTVEVRRV